MKEHNSWRAFGASQIPTSGGSVVPISPGLINNFESWTTELK
jgi:hypothetical protein